MNDYARNLYTTMALASAGYTVATAVAVELPDRLAAAQRLRTNSERIFQNLLGAIQDDEAREFFQAQFDGLIATTLSGMER